MYTLPSKVFLVGGVGYGNHDLTAFDFALMQAGIGEFNLVKLSSVFPVRGRLEVVQAVGDEPPDFYAEYPQGTLMPAVYSSQVVSEAYMYASACVGVGVPRDPDGYGMIYEYHGHTPGELAQDIVRSMLAEGLAARGISAYDEHILSREVVLDRDAPHVGAVVVAAVMI